MRCELFFQGISIGFSELVPGDLSIGEFEPGAGYAMVRDTIRAASESLWAMGFFTDRSDNSPVVLGHLSQAAALRLDLRDIQGSPVEADFVNIVELPDPSRAPAVFARFRLAHSRTQAVKHPTLVRDSTSSEPDA